MPQRRARLVTMLDDSERLERELGRLIDQLVAFTNELTAQTQGSVGGGTDSAQAK